MWPARRQSEQLLLLVVVIVVVLLHVVLLVVAIVVAGCVTRTPTGRDSILEIQVAKEQQQLKQSRPLKVAQSQPTDCGDSLHTHTQADT